MITKNLGNPLAIGRTAELYAWEDGWVLKLFFDWFDLENIQFEQSMAQTVHFSGLPVPAVGHILQVNGRNGLIYEYVNGQNMWGIIQKQPWRFIASASQTAQLHSEMHSNPLQTNLPSQRRRLENKLRGANPLSDLHKQTLLAALSALPDDNCICHGDFHPGNILVDHRRHIVIDWIDASRGNPLADVARTTVILLGAAASSQIPIPAMKVIIRLFHAVYLQRYFIQRPGGEAEYQRWLPIVAAARLSENIPELKKWLLEQAGKAL
jgi:uncharacterized protein (TIGR02172 family)